MESKIKVSVNSTTLIALIDYENPNPKVINELRIVLTNSSSDVDFTGTNIHIPWYDFKRALLNVSRLLKREKVEIEFDEFSLKLLNDYLDDRKKIKDNKLIVDINEDQVELLLATNGFNRKLKNEQKRDVLKLLHLKHGANFSVPGAGKTTTILAVHTILKCFDKVDKLFVVSPINAFLSWEEEIREIFTQSEVKILRLTSENMLNLREVISYNPSVVLVNYEKLRKDISILTPFFIENKIHLILDESHRIKSGTNNLSYTQITKLSDLATRRDILSGTPMPQSYLDLSPQLDFLWPGEQIIPRFTKSHDSAKIIEEVNASIKGLYVRTTKKELDLKDPDIFYTQIPMGSIQKQLYKLFKSEAARTISGMDNFNKSNFRKIGRSVVRLLQASTNPMLLGLKNDFDDDILPIPEQAQVWELLEEFIKYEKPTKIEYLKKRVKEITDENNNNKIVIWSYFIRNIQLLERIFKDYNPVSIYGAVTIGSDEDENNREGRIRKFHEDSTCRLMIANPQACGEGISLHKVCHYAIYLDRNFNAAHFLQSIDRIHRLGLNKEIDTKIEILVAENSIDEVLIKRLNEKIKAMGEILDDSYLKTLAYDPSDIPISDEDGIDYKDFEEIKKHLLNG